MNLVLTKTFRLLAKSAEKFPEQKKCALILDGTAIRKQALYDNFDLYVGFIGYVGALVERSEELSTEALVFLLIGLRGHWKCPIGYFLINKTSANADGNKIEGKYFQKLHEIQEIQGLELGSKPSSSHLDYQEIKRHQQLNAKWFCG